MPNKSHNTITILPVNRRRITRDYDDRRSLYRLHQTYLAISCLCSCDLDTMTLMKSTYVFWRCTRITKILARVVRHAYVCYRKSVRPAVRHTARRFTPKQFSASNTLCTIITVMLLVKLLFKAHKNKLSFLKRSEASTHRVPNNNLDGPKIGWTPNILDHLLIQFSLPGIPVHTLNWTLAKIRHLWSQYRESQKNRTVFLKVGNSRICWHRIAFYIPNCSLFYSE